MVITKDNFEEVFETLVIGEQAYQYSLNVKNT